MKARLVLDGRPAEVDLSAPRSLAWPLHFDQSGHNPDAFSLPRPQARPFQAGSFVGDVAQGGSVNCFVLSVCAHGAGTHTECRGHITPGGGDVTAALDEGLLPATVVTARPVRRAESPDRAAGEWSDQDLVVGVAQLSTNEHLVSTSQHHRAIIVRVLTDRPDPPSFSGSNPPYFTVGAIELLRGLGCRHLLTDLPSIDREHDGGHTPSHHAFFAGDEARTITEMARLPASLPDGRYMLDLQVPPFVFESAPSRPLLFAVRNVVSPAEEPS